MPIVDRTFGFAVIDGAVVQADADRPLSQSDWELWLAHARKRMPGRILVFTPGPEPSATQRRTMLEEAPENSVDHLPGTTIIKPIGVARGIVTAFSWFGYEIWAFSAVGYRNALDFLAVSSKERAILQSVAALCKDPGDTYICRILIANGRKLRQGRHVAESQ